MAVLQKPGVYTLVDNHSSKRLKVTVTERPEEPLQSDSSATVRLHPPAPGKGDKDGRSRASSTQNAERSRSAEANNAGRGEDLSSYARSKKKNKGKEKSGAVPAVTTSTVATLAGNDVSTSTTEALIRAEAAEAIPEADVARGAQASAGVPKAPSPLPLLPPIRVKQGGDGLSLDELAEHSTLHGVHVVNVSHRRGFEPAALEVGFTPGLGACIMCDLDSQQRVTREVVCRRLVGREGRSSTASTAKEIGPRSVVGGLGGVSNAYGAIGGDEDAEDDAEEGEDDPDIKSARLGPGILNKCYFILGRSGDYRISYRGDASRGVSVVVRLPLSSSEGLESAREGVMRAPSTSELEVSREGTGVARPSSSDGVDVSEEGGRSDSAAAASSDEENSAVLSGPAATATESEDPQVGCATDVSSSRPTQGGHESEHSSAAAGAAAGGGFSLGSAPMDWDNGQGGFVHQRAQMKKKSRRLKRNTAAAALAVASAQEADRTEAAAAAAESSRGAVGESAVGDQTSAAPAIPRDTGASNVSRSSTYLRRDQSTPATSSSQGTTGNDDDVMVADSSLNRVWAPTSALRGASISSKAADAETGSSEAAAAASAGSAVADKPASFRDPEVAPGNAESTSARQGQMGACKTRKQFDSKDVDSTHGGAASVTPAPTPPPMPQHHHHHQAPQRRVEVGKQKKGKLMRGDLSSKISGDAAPRAFAPSVLAAAGAGEEEKQKPQAAPAPTAVAAGCGDSSMGAWRGGAKDSAAYPQQYGGSTSSKGLPRASALDRARPRNQSRGTSVSGRWGNPPATVFAQPHPPQRIHQGRGGEGGRSASFGPRADDPAAGGGSVGVPISARLSTIVVGSGEQELAGVGGESLSACGGSESRESPAVLPPAGATKATAGVVPPGRVSSRTDSCRSRPPVSKDESPSLSPTGRFTPDRCRGAPVTSGARVAVDKEGLPRPHSVLGQATAIGVQSVRSADGSGGKGNVGANESACSSLGTTVVEGGRSWADVSASNPSDLASLGSTSSTRASNIRPASTNTLNKKQKKKAKAAERKAAMRKAAAAAKSGAAAASLAEESTLKPFARLEVPRAAEPDRSSAKLRRPVVVTPEAVAAGSHVDVHEAGAGSSSGGGSGGGGGVAASPCTSLKNVAPLERVPVDSASGPTAVSSSGGWDVPTDTFSNDEGGVARVSSMPRLASGGWTHAAREVRGGVEEKGTGGASAPNPAGHAAGDDGDGAGAGRMFGKGPNHPLPPSELASMVTEATSAPAAATPTQAQALQRLPPGFGGDRLCDEAYPSAANVPEGTTNRASYAPTGAPPGFDGDHLRDEAYPLAATVAGGGMKSATRPPNGASTTPTVIPEAAAAAAGTLATAALANNPTGGRAQNSAKRGGGGGFGNCSTNISLEERSRRNRVLSADATPFFPARYGHGDRRGYRTVQQAKPAQFPEESRLPGGGYFVEEGPDDTLPPPSAFEMQEAAHMMKVFNDMMERLRTTGMDETLPNGFTPRIYDFTEGGC